MQTPMETLQENLPATPQVQQTQQLIALCQQGDKAAFHRLYQRYVAKVYALCLKLTGRDSLAEEATQEVFVQVWKKLKHYRGDSQFTTWLHRVTSNVTISYLRSQKSFWRQMFNIEDEEGLALVAESDTHSVPFEQYVARLPERARIVFVLHAIEGYRHDEIASMMKIAVGSSKAQFHRAKLLLKEWMGYSDE